MVEAIRMSRATSGGATGLGPGADASQPQGPGDLVICHQIKSFDWKAQGARSHPMGSLSNNRLELVREIVGQILAFVV